MRSVVKSTNEYGFCCEYCGRELYGSSAYGDIQSHERKCVKNPEVIAAGRAAVGKIYKLDDNHYVHVLQFNEDCADTPAHYTPIIRDGLLPSPTIYRSEFKNRPLVVEEIEFKYWETRDEWLKGEGNSISISISRRVISMDYNFQYATEITQDEWNEVLNRIIKESQL